MIPLRLKIDPLPFDEPMVVRLRGAATAVDSKDAELLDYVDGVAEYDLCGMSLRVHADSASDIENDVLLLMPGASSAHRLIRAKSQHNTFLVTERCDQLCVMCSQPPKAHHTDLFACFEEAALLAPPGAYVGISGGEPTLFKHQLFELIQRTSHARPDVRFHVLTNGQHFEEDDVEIIRALGYDRVLWGIPLYSPHAARHDEVVAKPGAYEKLMHSLALMARAGAAIELRSVVLKPTINDLPDLARLITTRLPYISVWAIMQLENIGYGRKNWQALFSDTSVLFDPIGRAVNLAESKGISTRLYNFPLCSVPEAYRAYAPPTISDWKKKFSKVCDRCTAQDYCSGFFEWYREEQGFQRLSAL